MKNLLCGACWRTQLMIFVLAGGIIPSLVVSAQAGDPLVYKDRGNRREGIRAKPVSGYDIELLGAMVEPLPASSSALRDELKVYFFLEDQVEVFLTVREREPETFYWLDNVRPRTPWRPRVTNAFVWPSQDVVGPLGINPAGLLVLARLGHATPNSLDPQEHVAPVVFAADGPPAQFAAYRFIYKVNAPAKVRFRIYPPGGGKALTEGPEMRRAADVPFDVRWEPGPQPEGRYRLLLEGYFLNDNVRFTHAVEFFHTSSWPRSTG